MKIKIFLTSTNYKEVLLSGVFVVDLTVFQNYYSYQQIRKKIKGTLITQFHDGTIMPQ